MRGLAGFLQKTKSTYAGTPSATREDACRRSVACPREAVRVLKAAIEQAARTTEGIGRTMGEQFSVFRTKASGRAGALRGARRPHISTLAAKEHLTTSRAHASPQVLRCSRRSMKPATTYAPVSNRHAHHAPRRPPSAPSERGQIKPRGTRQRPRAHTKPTLLTHSSSATTTLRKPP